MNLIIDTAHASCSVGLFLGEECVHLKAEVLQHGHASILPGMVRDVLLAKSQVQVANIIVNVGPGSFTGIRVGIAFAKGLAKGLGVPLWGVSTFQALAQVIQPGNAALILVDAKRQDLYCQFISESQEMSPPLNLTPTQLAAQFDLNNLLCVGNAVDQVKQSLQRTLKSLPDEKPMVTLLNAAFQKGFAHTPANPFYLRSADVTFSDRSKN